MLTDLLLVWFTLVMGGTSTSMSNRALAVTAALPLGLTAALTVAAKCQMLTVDLKIVKL